MGVASRCGHAVLILWKNVKDPRSSHSILSITGEKLLLKIGFDAPVHSFDGEQASVKNQIISLILAVQTVMRS